MRLRETQKYGRSRRLLSDRRSPTADDLISTAPAYITAAPTRTASLVAVDFHGVTYLGPPVNDRVTFDQLPADLRQLLEQANGLVAYQGGLHLRGATHLPDWHSLRAAWEGPTAFHKHYASLSPADVPFGQDAVGDQWLLRDEKVIRLRAETGELETTTMTFADFLLAVEQAPTDTLDMQPLQQFEAEGGHLEPGQLLSVYPPFCTTESATGVSLKAVPAAERLAFLADLARKLPAEGKVRFVVEE